MAEVSIVAGRRGIAYIDGNVVARIGMWDARIYPSGDWDGSCECEWYRGNNPEAFERLTSRGADVVLVLFDFNEARYECSAVATATVPLSAPGDVVAALELELMGTGPAGCPK